VSHGRKCGDGDSYPIPVWNGIFDHYKRIGNAVWVFMWLIDRIPKDGERDGVGNVLGGKPIKIPEIMDTVKGSTYKSVRDQLGTLEEQGYITRRRTPYGYVIAVRNSRKWNIWTAKETGQKGQSLPEETSRKGQSDGQRLPLEGAEIALFGRNKENTAVHSSRETQQRTAAWKALGSDLPMGTPQFQGIYEHYFSTRNDNLLSDVMERTILAAQSRGVPVPKPFYSKKRQVESREARITNSVTNPTLPVLEVESWAK